MIYSDIFLSFLRNTAHAGDIDDDCPTITERAGSIVNGDVIVLMLAIDSNKIKKASFRAQGSPAIIAAGEYVCRQLEGKGFENISSELTANVILEALELPMHFVHIASLMMTVLQQCKDSFNGLQGSGKLP